MENKGIVLLVLPYAELYSPLVRMPPLGIAYLASYIAKEGFESEIFIGAEHGDADSSFIAFEKKLHENEYLALGISVISPTYAGAVRMAKITKLHNAKIPIIFGGVHATEMHKQILSENDCIDYVVRGDGEQTLVNILNAISSGQFTEVLGCSQRIGDKVINSDDRHPVENIDMFPFPKRNIKDYEYIVLHKDGQPVYNVNVVSSRGCPYNCSFCVVHHHSKKKWRARSPENVITEIREIANLFPAVCIRFVDDNFLVDIFRATQIAEKIKDLNNENLYYSFSARADQIIKCNEQTMELFKSSGCVSIEIGLESGSDVMLKRLCKGTTVDDNQRAIDILTRAKIELGADFIMFDRESTFGEIFENINFIKKNNLQNCYPFNLLNRVVPYPGTTAYKSGKYNGKRYFVNPSVEDFYHNACLFNEAYGESINRLLSIMARKSFSSVSRIVFSLDRTRIVSRQFIYFTELYSRYVSSSFAKMKSEDAKKLPSFKETSLIVDEMNLKYN